MQQKSTNKWILLFGLIYTIALLVVSLVRIKEDVAPVHFNNADKVFHFCAYFGLTMLWHFYYLKKKGRLYFKTSLWICTLAAVFGIIIEILQLEMTSYRGFELLDIVADIFGVVLAFIVVSLAGQIKKSR